MMAGIAKLLATFTLQHMDAANHLVAHSRPPCAPAIRIQYVHQPGAPSCSGDKRSNRTCLSSLHNGPLLYDWVAVLQVRVAFPEFSQRVNFLFWFVCPIRCEL